MARTKNQKTGGGEADDRGIFIVDRSKTEVGSPSTLIDRSRSKAATVFETAADKDVKLTKEAKTADRKMRQSRSEPARPAAVKESHPCERCRREFDVYPSHLKTRVNDNGRGETFYRCPKCDGRGS